MSSALNTKNIADTEPRLRPAASWVTPAGIGILAVVMGVSFVVLRPIIVLLPEDQRFTGLTPDQLKALNAQLFIWMGLVFRSWGAFAIRLGILVTAVASTAYRQGDRWAWWALAVSGLLTFGIFLAVNLTLGSDFKFQSRSFLQRIFGHFGMGVTCKSFLSMGGLGMSQMKTFFGSTTGLICSLCIAAFGAYLLVYHVAHVALVVPYLFLLACPLMHFMHRGHHHHGAKTDSAANGSPPNKT